MIRRPPRSTLDRSSAASDVYKRQVQGLAGPLVPLLARGTEEAGRPVGILLGRGGLDERHPLIRASRGAVPGAVLLGVGVRGRVPVLQRDRVEADAGGGREQEEGSAKSHRPGSVGEATSPGQ